MGDEGLEPMSQFPKPKVDELRLALREAGSALADDAIEFLAEGSDFWVFSAGAFVLRCPKSDLAAGRLEREEVLMRELAPMLPLAVPVPSLVCREGPNGQPVSGYVRVAGVPLRQLKRPLAPGFGADLGGFLRALRGFSVARAVEIGLEFVDGPKAKTARIAKYERLAREVFPHFTCETRTNVARVVVDHINDAANYDFEPCLSHGDIDERGLLADPETGELTGVIDFLGADLDNPVGDFTWAFGGGFRQLGIEDQLPALLAAGGLDEGQLVGWPEFVPVWSAVQDLAHGIEIDDDALAHEGLAKLNELTPYGQVCSPLPLV